MLDEKYILLISNRLRNFKKTDTHAYKCSCPVCGDSATDSTRTRGNFYIYNGDWMYHCYNCHFSSGVPHFLRTYYNDIYNDYIAESFGGKKTKYTRRNPDKKDIIDTSSLAHKFLINTTKLTNLPENHQARIYINNRQIPEKNKNDIYYVRNFNKFVNILIPDKMKNVDYDEERVVFPFFDETKKIIGFQGRSLNPKSKVKYITIKFDENIPKIYGRNRVDASRVVYVVEGIMDSMFIRNAVADMGSGFKSAIKKYKNRVLILDNEPYSEIIVKKMKKFIKDGESIVIWRESNKLNDINDFIISGRTANDVMKEIKERTFFGLQAELELMEWSKVR